MSAPPRPKPIIDNLTEEFWAAVAEGRLLVQECSDCGKPQFYPRGHCIHCFGDALRWREASGRGTLHTFSVIYQSSNEEFDADVPYVLAIVELDEGVRMTSRVVDVDIERVHCDMPLQVVFRKLEDGGPDMPLFTTTGDQS